MALILGVTEAFIPTRAKGRPALFKENKSPRGGQRPHRLDVLRMCLGKTHAIIARKRQSDKAGTSTQVGERRFGT
jgi:hypothetical protein